ncbi:hypothetical protein HA402_000334 [Bradysia odoriphaga]|nr:hypothetical protein HA402_000334 [Bradysia odoriphaga]
MEEVVTATCIAPINIAVIKYWGKRDDKLILPVNDSISGTLSTDQLCAKTTISASPTYTETKYWLNGIEGDYKSNIRMKNVIKAMKKLAKKKCPKNKALKYKLHICSINNFPTAAGLASSAAGYSCLVYTLAQLYGIDNEDLTPIARVGSGSACRSLNGGFVHWLKGVSPTGEDSVAVQLCDENYWPEMRVLIIVVNEGKKAVSSTSGMSLTTTTSELFNYRIMKCVPERVRLMKKAIAERNFKDFGELTMKDSNQFHAVCLDTYPPCVYMTDVSHRIAAIIHGYNKNAGETCVAYTFDAGPNVCVYLLEKEVRRFVTMLAAFFPCDAYDEGKFVRGIPIKYLSKISEEYMTNLGGSSYIERDRVKYIIHTKLGSGPKRLDDPDDSLLGADGLPKANPKVQSSIEQEVSVPPCEPHEVPPENVMYLGVPWGPQWAEQWLAQWGKPNGASWGGHGFPFGAPPGIAIKMDAALRSKVKIESTESSKSTSSNESDDATTSAARPDRQNAFQDLESKASTLNKLMDVDVEMSRVNQ